MLTKDKGKKDSCTAPQCDLSVLEVNVSDEETRDDEVEALRKENNDLKIRIETMKELIDSMLEDKNGRKTTDQKSEWQTPTKK